MMRLAQTAAEARQALDIARRQGRRIGLVPTMGALHQGHLSLVRAARAKCDYVAASIFVNPTQFGPTEDLARYPRPFEKDRALLEAEKVDLLFAPAVEEMYPRGAATFVTVEGMSDRLCGRFRPGHFRGVTTIVAKLFHIVEPDVAFFGQKDAAQVAIIKRMVRDLDFPVTIEVGETVRESDGLAMSSRNAYLNPEEREQALALWRALQAVQQHIIDGERDPEALRKTGAAVFAREPAVRLEYLEMVDPETLEPVTDISGGALIALAAHVGNTRLIDNVMIPSQD